MPDRSLDALRKTGMRLLGALILLLAVVAVAMVAALEAANPWPIVLMAVALPIYPAVLVVNQSTHAHARMAMSVTCIAMPALLLFVAKGQIWQTDLHMLFFALIAVVAILCDWRTILAAAAVIAVHHLGFGMLVPAWSFERAGSVERVGLHAVILLIEASSLILIVHKIVSLIELVDRTNVCREYVTASLGEALAALQAGDLTREITAEYPPSCEDLRANFNTAVASLRMTIGAWNASADRIRAGTRDIAGDSTQLAERTARDAVSLRETAVVLVHVERRLRATAATSGLTSSRADQAITIAEEGRSIADEAVQAMGWVSNSAKDIEGVIEGLDKIAFQARVLAMNAAVEARRAGDAGRGFAVVADLVSALAMRLEDQARRAWDQLSITQDGMATAVRAVQGADLAFAKVAAGIGDFHEAMSGIAIDNKAQSAAVSQISASVGALDQSTQHNAEMVEQIADAVHRLNSEAKLLVDNASLFRTEGVPTARPDERPQRLRDSAVIPSEPMRVKLRPPVLVAVGSTAMNQLEMVRN